MTIFTINMSTDNAAFDDDHNGELVRILRGIADKIEQQGCSGFFETVRDINGNDVGRYALKNDDGSNHNI